MYRHFAVVTVLLTAGLAMFADGENREAIAARLEAQKPESTSSPKPVRLRTGQRADPGSSSFASVGQAGDFDPDFGRPTENPHRGRNRSAISVTDLAAAGYTAEYLATLSPEERALLLAQLAESGLLAPGELERRSAQLAAASARRSGAPAAWE